MFVVAVLGRGRSVGRLLDLRRSSARMAERTSLRMSEKARTDCRACLPSWMIVAGGQGVLFLRWRVAGGPV